MSNKATILTAIRNNKPAAATLPEVPVFQRIIDKLALFQQMVEAGGGTVVTITEDKSLPVLIQNLFPYATRIASTSNEITGTVDLNNIQQPSALESVEVAILPSQLAVAENGALWITEKECVHRVLPFITQHLVIIIKSNNIVQNMHEAYQKNNITDTGFGVFIAGPSKTADIEQSLVIGAQGARSLHVFIKSNN